MSFECESRFHEEDPLDHTRSKKQRQSWEKETMNGLIPTIYVILLSIFVRFLSPKIEIFFPPKFNLIGSKFLKAGLFNINFI